MIRHTILSRLSALTTSLSILLLLAIVVPCLRLSRMRGDRVPSCRHRAGGVGQFLAGMQFSTKVLKCVVIC